MQTIERLKLEHRLISAMTDGLEAITARAKADRRVPDEAYELLSLFDSFADGRHQDKEEQVLFVELLDVAEDHDRSILSRLLGDHEKERRHMSGMRVSLLGAVHGEPGCVREFVHEADAYSTLHRSHMLRESEIMLPMVARLLTPDADLRVTVGFEKVEGGPGDPHGIEEQVGSLLRRIGLPVPPAA